MSLARLLQGHGFRNTARYRIWSDYNVYEVDVEWADGETETIRCHQYAEKETGLAIKVATEPYLGVVTNKIHRGYDEDRVLVNMEEYTVREIGETVRRETEVDVPDWGLITPSTPQKMYSSVAQTGYELVGVE